jgi:hypothetical protein
VDYLAGITQQSAQPGKHLPKIVEGSSFRNIWPQHRRQLSSFDGLAVPQSKDC